MLTLTMPSRRADEKWVNFNARVPFELREKASIAAARKNSDLSKQARIFLEQLVAEHEAKFGPIALAE